MNTADLTQLIKSRRSIFPAMYTDRRIERETLLSILENGNWAPTHRKTEPWRFKIYQGESLKTLSNYLGDYYKENTPSEKFSEIKYKKTSTLYCWLQLMTSEANGIDVYQFKELWAKTLSRGIQK